MPAIQKLPQGGKNMLVFCLCWNSTVDTVNLTVESVLKRWEQLLLTLNNSKPEEVQGNY